MNHDECLQWLRDSPKETISPKELSRILGGDPYYYNIAAKNGTLKLPHMWMGRNLRIFKGPVIRVVEAGEWPGKLQGGMEE